MRMVFSSLDLNYLLLRMSGLDTLPEFQFAC